MSICKCKSFIALIFLILSITVDTSLVAQQLKKELKAENNFTWVAKGKHRVSYQVFLPSNFKRKKTDLPIIIGFTPRGNGQMIISKMKNAAEKMGWILVGVDSLRNNMKNDQLEIEMEDEVMDDILTNIPHFSKRIYLAGFSGGAMRSYGLTVRRPEKFAGVIAYGGWLGGNDYQNVAYPGGMSIAMVVGNNDKGAGNWIDIDTKTLQQKNNEVKLFTFIGGHEIAPSAITEEVVLWLQKEWSSKKAFLNCNCSNFRH